ncbi:MAG: hypothetical protein IJL09_08985 [Lachnospiraceae bacterium]|nr:hypothetical protein [Lachnospiraceae bacterium]
MDWKRTKVSYVLWALFLAMTAIASWQILEVFCGQKGIHGYYVYLITAGVLLVGGAVGALIIVARNKLFPHVKENALALLVFEAVILIAALVAGILSRIQALPNAESGNLYLLAQMRYQTQLPETAHVGENIYLALLHFVCFMLGNIPEIVLRFQMILTILAGLVWYTSVRRLAGVLPALFFAGFYFLDERMIGMASHLTAEPLILLLYGIGLCFIGAALKEHGKSFVLYLIAGLWIGITAHADILGFTLLAFALSIWHLDKEKGEGRIYGKTAAAAFLFLGTSVGFLACEALWSLIHVMRFGGSFMAAFGNQWQGVQSFAFIGLPAFREIFNGYLGSICSVVLVGVLAFGICGFFRKDQKERISPWIVISLFVLGAMLIKQLPTITADGLKGLTFSVSGVIDKPFDGSVLLILCFFVLGAIGITNIFRPEVFESEQKESKVKAKLQSFRLRDIPAYFRRRKAERKAALIYTVDHPEVMNRKNPVSKILYARAKKRIESQREIDKVMYALNSLSGDHIVLEDFSRDPYPEATLKENVGGLFHHKKHDEEAKKEEKIETKTETKAEAMAETKVDIKAADAKAEIKADAVAESKAASSATAADTMEKTDAKAETKKEESLKSEIKAENLTDRLILEAIAKAEAEELATQEEKAPDNTEESIKPVKAEETKPSKKEESTKSEAAEATKKDEAEKQEATVTAKKDVPVIPVQPATAKKEEPVMPEEAAMTKKEENVMPKQVATTNQEEPMAREENTDDSEDDKFRDLKLFLEGKLTFEENTQESLADKWKREAKTRKAQEEAEAKKDDLEILEEPALPKAEEQVIPKEPVKAKADDLIILEEPFKAKADDLIILEEPAKAKADDLIILEEPAKPKADDLVILEEAISTKAQTPTSVAKALEDQEKELGAPAEKLEGNVQRPEKEDKEAIKIVEIEDLGEPKTEDKTNAEKPKSEDFMYVSLHSRHSKEKAQEKPASNIESASADDFKFESIRDRSSKRLRPGEKLHNPLPLPKKHVSSEMDYDYEVSDDDDYDID